MRDDVTQVVGREAGIRGWVGPGGWAGLGGWASVVEENGEVGVGN